MMRKRIRRLFQIVLIPLIGGTVGLVLLALAFMLPTDRIYTNVRASLDMLDRETSYFSITPALQGAQLDNFTEALYLNEALVNTKNASLKECVLSGYVFDANGDDGDSLTALSYAVTEPDSIPLFPSCKRFFNGYEVAVKPLLMLTTYSGIRQVNLYLSLFLSLLLLYCMQKRGLRRYIPPMIVSVLFIRPLTLSLNMTFFGFYVCMLVPCICILLLEKETLREKAWLLFGIAGAATYYFNMNYIQLLSFGIPMLFYFLAAGIPERPLELLGTIAAYLFVWIVGCIGMMVFKWVVYAVFIDRHIFGEMAAQFFSRTDVDRGSRFSAIARNMKTGFGNLWWNVLEAIFVIGNLAARLYGKRRLSITRSEFLLLALMILLTAGRYFILSNHVIIHHWVTYRLIMIPVLTFNILITNARSEHGVEPAERIYP